MRHDRGVTSIPADLLELAHAYGVATEFHDWRGRRVDVPEQTVDGGARRDGRRRRRPARGAGRPRGRALAADAAAGVVVVAGRGAAFAGARHRRRPGRGGRRPRGRRPARPAARSTTGSPPREVGGRRIGEATFAVPTDLPLGYHRLRARSGADTEATATLIVTPAWLGLPESVRGPARRGAWPPSSTASARRQSWGVGDLVDLTDLAVWSGAELGADYVLVNPLHAAEPRRAARALAVPAHLAPVLQPALRAGRAGRGVRRAAGRRARDASTRSPPSVHARARRRGRRSTATPRGPRSAPRCRSCTPRRAAPAARSDLAAFRGAAGRRAARLRHLVRARRGARQRLPRLAGRAAATCDSPAVAAFAASARRPRSTSRRWLQWVRRRAARSWPRPRRSAPAWRSASMHDLAVGVHPGGADAWRLRSTSTPRASRSAPRRTRTTSSARTGASRRGARTGSPSSATQPFRDLIARRAAARRRGPGRPHHRAVPAVVDPARAGRRPRAPTCATTTRR